MTLCQLPHIRPIFGEYYGDPTFGYRPWTGARDIISRMALPVVNPQHPASTRGFERIAREAAERFRGKHLRVHRYETVHAVGWYRWIGRLYLPGPACRTGWAGVGAQGDLHAVDPGQPITCHKCEPTQEAEILRRFMPEPARQLSLDEVEPDELALFAPPEPDPDHHR